MRSDTSNMECRYELWCVMYDNQFEHCANFDCITAYFLQYVVGRERYADIDQTMLVQTPSARHPKGCTYRLTA